MTVIGIAITAATIMVLAVGYFHTRRARRFPAYGWFGYAALASAEILMFLRIEPVSTYFTPIAWSAYILIVDAAILAVTGRSRLNDAPGILGRMALVSIPLWMIFEIYNFRLHNWTYVGVPAAWPAALLGYGWSFATITPGIFESADLVQAILPRVAGRPWKVSSGAENMVMGCGAACLILPLALPQRIGAYLFALIWVGFLLLLDPINRRLALPSFLGDLSEGFRRRFYAFVAAGWICGWLWEFWNNWAAAKWHYTFPMFQRWKIFEMPAPGFLGFLPFALECFTMYVAVAGLFGWIKPVR